ncbi:uncharacterized protein LOC126215172 isoform X1 [Schistocerca nitens]|uniref:uncharacterized protein LOC126215172 isoform X1 n=1 Tax=Schistocerca nitens TaxID=7011 RepID=UPI00211963CA|nr:uncharacterized protein LOC126215172 isoform X1 [Schistocerca nitens]
MGICIYFAEALTAVAILHALEVRVWLWQLTEILSTALPTRWPTVSLLSWTFVGLLFWAYLYLLYYRMVQLLLKRMELIEPHRSLLVETFWKAGFLCCSVTYFITKFILDHGTNVDDWLPELVKQNIFHGNDPVAPCSKKYFGLYCAFYVHDLWMTTSRRGFNLTSSTKLFFYLFVLTAHLMRCVKAAYLFVILMNIEALPACGAAAFVLFDRPVWRGAFRIAGVGVISRILFAAHAFLWATNMFFLLPTLLLYPAVTTEVRQPDVLPLIALNAVLWTFYCLNFVTSPTCRLIYLYLQSPTSGVKHRSLLDTALFPPETDVIKELQRIREEVRATRNRRAKEAAAGRRSEHHSGSVTACDINRRGLKLYQTIKCVMAVKRRLKRQREMQQALAEDESSESPTTTSPAESSPAESSPATSTPDTPLSPDFPVSDETDA